MDNLAKPNPISAWGTFMCCVGAFWTMISWFQVTANINTITGTQRVAGWEILVPIYANIRISEAVNALNEIIASKKLDVAPIQENMILNIFFCPITYMWLFKGNLEVVEALEKQAGK